LYSPKHSQSHISRIFSEPFCLLSSFIKARHQTKLVKDCSEIWVWEWFGQYKTLHLYLEAFQSLKTGLEAFSQTRPLVYWNTNWGPILRLSLDCEVEPRVSNWGSSVLLKTDPGAVFIKILSKISNLSENFTCIFKNHFQLYFNKTLHAYEKLCFS